MNSLLKLILSFLFLFCLFGCQKNDQRLQSNIELVGHGGSGFYSIFNPYPINSKISIEHALYELGADGVDVDVQVDMDGTLWLFHDNLLELSSNCFGCIGERSTEEIESCIYSNLSFPNERIYKATDLIQKLNNLENKPFVLFDVKIYEGCYDAVKMRESITSIIDVFDARSWIRIGSTSLDLISAIEAEDSSFLTYYEVSDPRALFEDSDDKVFDGVLSKNEEIDERTVLDFQNDGFQLMLFNAEGKEKLKQVQSKHPNYLITDDILTSRSVLNN